MTVSTVWRSGLFVLASVTMMVLIVRFVQCRKEWNAKTRDYWYALMMWAVTSIVVAVSGLHEHVNLNIRLVFITAATLGTLIGVTRKGPWGSDR